MVKVRTHKKGDWTAELANDIMQFLLDSGIVEVPDEETGFQETSEAMCDFEVHIIKKRVGQPPCYVADLTPLTATLKGKHDEREDA